MLFGSFLSGGAQAQTPAQTQTQTQPEHPQPQQHLRQQADASEHKIGRQQQVAGQQESATERLRRLLHASASRLGVATGAPVATTGGGDATTKTSDKRHQPAAVVARGANPKEWQLERKYTLSEVQQHSSLDDCWMVIFDKVYNITEFVYEHPGGDFILLEYAGRDATQPFLSSRHGSSAYKMLDKYWIGILVDEELYYSNNSSYCSAYSSLSWRSTPTLEASPAGSAPQVTTTPTTTATTLPGLTTATNSSCEDETEEEEKDDDDDERDEALSRENSLDSITLRGEPEAPPPPPRVPGEMGARENGTEVSQGQASADAAAAAANHLSSYHIPAATTAGICTSTNSTRAATATATSSSNAPRSRAQQQQQQQSPMLMIEYHKSYEPRRHLFELGESTDEEEEEEEEGESGSEEDSRVGSGRGRDMEKEEDADSDFGDEQRECNTCGGSGPTSAAIVASLAAASRPQAIVRSWSSGNSATAGTLTTPLMLADEPSTEAAYLSSRTLRWRSSRAAATRWTRNGNHLSGYTSGLRSVTQRTH